MSTTFSGCRRAERDNKGRHTCRYRGGGG